MALIWLRYYENGGKKGHESNKLFLGYIEKHRIICYNYKR